MKFVLKYILVLSLVISVSACSTTRKHADQSIRSFVEAIPFVHRQIIVQGTILSQRKLDNLTPGMSMEEVIATLGSPSLVDIFHQNRWDYIYWYKAAGEDPVQKTLSLHFVDGFVDRIEDNYPPDKIIDIQEKRVVLTVPDYKKKGIFRRLLD